MSTPNGRARIMLAAVVHVLLAILLVSANHGPQPTLTEGSREAAALDRELRHDFKAAAALRREILEATRATFGDGHWKTRDAIIAAEDVQVLSRLPKELLDRFERARSIDEQYLADVPLKSA